jgi:hypothetical protein
MFRLQLRVLICNVSKNYFRLQLELRPPHFYSVWTPKMNLLLGYIRISFGCNQIFNIWIMILIKFVWHKKFWRQDYDHDQIYAASKFLTSRLAVLILELGIKIFNIRILIVIQSRLHQNFGHQNYDLVILIMKLDISFNRLWTHHQLLYRSILELGICSIWLWSSHQLTCKSNICLFKIIWLTNTFYKIFF